MIEAPDGFNSDSDSAEVDDAASTSVASRDPNTPPDSTLKNLIPRIDAAHLFAHQLESLRKAVLSSVTSPPASAAILGGTSGQFIAAGLVGKAVTSASAQLLDGLVSAQTRWRQQLATQLSTVLKPAIDTKAFRELERNMLPANLRDASDKITPLQVYDFLESEGIPLYLVPRASVGVRLLTAPDHGARRKVLNDRFKAIVEDCEALIARSTDPIVATEVYFAKDAIAALRSGNYASAQALCTVTLDTLISRFYPTRATRQKLTNRKAGDPIPDLIKDMGLRNAYVWLPIWNSHGQFWIDKGDRIPNDFSRHATIHGVSKAQYNQRNCVQSLMLVASLIGYADLITKHERNRRSS